MAQSRGIWGWIKDRATEPSTLRGLTGVLMVMGIYIDPALLETILTVGIGIISTINIVKKDRR